MKQYPTFSHNKLVELNANNLTQTEHSQTKKSKEK